MLGPDNEISDLEIDLMLLFYTFSDQHGNVDMRACQRWAKERLGVTIKDRPFKITQMHINVLVKHGVLPDINGILSKFKDARPDKL